jgi:hypothetical protein
MAITDRYLIDGGGVEISLSPTFVPEDSAARNAVANAAAQPPAAPVDTRIALRKLQSGQSLTDDEKRSLGLPVTDTTVVSKDVKPKGKIVTNGILIDGETGSPFSGVHTDGKTYKDGKVVESTWVKSNTVNTANGPVDVDANGLAADGSRPVAVTTKVDGNVPAGFNSGAFPKELEQYFGSSAGYLGWRIITNEDGSQQLEVADAPGTTKTFGFKFKPSPTGGYTKFDTSTSGLGGGAPTVIDTGGSTGATAFDVFKNTLSLFFGPKEIGKPWVSQLYKTVSGFTKSGSTPEEAFNMAVLESENKPEMADFVKRFKGIYALQKMKQEGKAVTVPTVAEYFATETKMGDILKASNLGELANEDFLGDVLSKGINATQFGDRIVDIFDRIDSAPDAIKKTISRFFPTLDRIQLAKALALGDKGAKQLQQELTGYEVLSAAEQQGLGVSPTLLSGITNERAQQIARGGGTFASTLGQFGQIASARETEQKLAEISGMKSLGVSGLTSAVIDKSATELKKLEDLTKQEEARFSAKAGTIGSKSLASQSRANRVI